MYMIIGQQVNMHKMLSEHALMHENDKIMLKTKLGKLNAWHGIWMYLILRHINEMSLNEWHTKNSHLICY